MLTREEQLGAAKPGIVMVLPVAIETIEVKLERVEPGLWRATSDEVPGLLVEAATPGLAEAAVPAAVRALREDAK